LEHVYEELFKKIHCDEKETVANCTVVSRGGGGSQLRCSVKIFYNLGI